MRNMRRVLKKLDRYVCAADVLKYMRMRQE